MAGVLRMLFVVFCPLVLSESGDDDWSEKDVTCTSTLTLKQSNLTCSLNDEPNEEVKFATLCSTNFEVCVNATLGPRDFTFENVQIISEYMLQVRIGEEDIKKRIDLRKIVKIPAPEIKLATYMENTEEVFIWFEHSHDYISNPKFQVEFWVDKLPNKTIKGFHNYRNCSINRDTLGGDGYYYTRVRAIPEGYFEGSWSEWSSTANFTIKTNSTLSSPYIIIGFSVFLLLIISSAVLLWRTHIKGCITPNIPHPKATLAQMHRAREGLPFTFSPEIFSDVFIHRVDYVDEKLSALEREDGLDECCYSQSSSSNTSLSEMDMNADEQPSREQSHLKIRLLDESDLSKGRENSGCQGVTPPHLECKDEAYVTMSSLFKTQ
ncbi:interleukin-7 receptor subunit alpha [Pseudorasbora parva]|uniref:interleukin-7 receptor subunit alpha n=1 Tax=Pseudorasbora parva TaxID=51549 RepID=UPI00351F3812